MELEIILNQDNVSNLEEFIHTENRYCNGVKKTTFVFQLGCDSEEAFLKDIQKADEILSDVDKFSKCFYERRGILENYMSGSDREKYSDRIRKWEGGKERNISVFTFENAIWQEQYLKALSEVYDKIFEYDFSNRTVKYVHGSGSDTFGRIQNIPMQLEEATEQWIQNSVLECERGEVHEFFKNIF